MKKEGFKFVSNSFVMLHLSAAATCHTKLATVTGLARSRWERERSCFLMNRKFLSLDCPQLLGQKSPLRWVPPEVLNNHYGSWTYSCFTRLKELDTEDGNGDQGCGFVALWLCNEITVQITMDKTWGAE